MIIHDIEQNTPEWYEVRKLKFTASNATAIAAQGKGLETLVEKMAMESFQLEPKSFQSAAMQHGNETEAEAAQVYELETGETTVEVGFCELSEYVGCSPDILVGEEGLVEIKCKDDKGHFKHFVDGKIETGHIAQMQFQMHVTGRKWCDYVAYNPNFPRKYKMFKKRIFRDEAHIEKIKSGIEKGTVMLKKFMEDLEKREKENAIFNK